ncbi:MAG: isochorismate synthase [Gemmatimonadota bacterium]|nr:isochorismate synthase [Gemmatimonadota bacterium]
MRRPSDIPRLATVTIPAPDLRPERFLARAAGASRGFWVRGDRWVAHTGVAADVRVDRVCRAADRFAEVAGEARRLAANPVLAPGATRAPRIRFYGGFSFEEGHEAHGTWSGFPSARFIVPELELEGDGSGDAWLRARARVEAEGDEAALRRLRHLAEATRAELAALGEPSDGAPSEVPGHASSGPRTHWEDAVRTCLEAIRAGRVSKAVLARTLSVELDRPLDPADVVMQLWHANHGSHVFLFEPEPGAALVGAAPETVATLRDGVFHATAVAGSIRRGSGPREQAELAAELLASDKDREEQRIALDDMVARLGTVAHQVRSDPQPHVLTLSRIQHLETEIRASVPVGVGVLDLLRILHPTPAVCGLPRDAALAVLATGEPFERGWYSGPVGWFDPEGNGVFAPALRTGVGRGDQWELFAGAGIVEGSSPRSEWEETGIKFQPMLEALEAGGVRLVERASAGRTGEAPADPERP